MPIEIEFWTSDESLRDLGKDYWTLGPDGAFLHSVTALAERQGTTMHQLPKLIGEFCAAFGPDDCCVKCGGQRVYKSRNDYSQHKARRTTWTCEDCVDRAREAERVAKEEADGQRHAALSAAVASARTAFPSADDLEFTEAVYLISVVRAGAADDLSHIRPLEHFVQSLTPSAEYDQQVLTSLHRDGILSVHPGSHGDSVTMEAGAFTHYFHRRVHWLVPLPEGPTLAKYLDLVERRLDEKWPSMWQREADVLHRELAVFECCAYLTAQMEDHDFSYAPNEKATAAIRSALRSYTMGQVYNFAYRAARDAASFLLRKANSAQHAMNIVPGAIARHADRATAEKQTVKSFGRDSSVPESALSHVLFTKALKLPAGGFDTVPPADE